MDIAFLQLSERWRLAYDRHQWIVQRKHGKQWRSGPFISSKRSTLIRYLLDEGAVVDDWRVIAMLPDTFREWIRMRAEASFKTADSDETIPQVNAGHYRGFESDAALKTRCSVNVRFRG